MPPNTRLIRRYNMQIPGAAAAAITDLAIFSEDPKLGTTWIVRRILLEFQAGITNTGAGATLIYELFLNNNLLSRRVDLAQTANSQPTTIEIPLDIGQNVESGDQFRLRVFSQAGGAGIPGGLINPVSMTLYGDVNVERTNPKRMIA